MINLKETILKTIGISSDEYAKTIWEMGNKYCRIHINDDLGERLVMRSKNFWFWFQNQWNIKDIEVLAMIEVIPMDVRKKYWLRAHCPCNAVAYPGKEVWSEVHEAAIAEMIAESHKTKDGGVEL